MTALPATPRGSLVVLAAVSFLLVGWPAATFAQEAELTATLELPEGEIDFAVQPGTLQFFDEEGAPFAVQVVDSCAVNGHWWVIGIGLGPEALPLTVFDERSGMSHETVLPAFRPGEPIGAVFEPEALAICRGGPTGGLPPVQGSAIYTSASPACNDAVSSLDLLSDGEEEAYRSFVRSGETNRVISDEPIAVIDDSSEWDELHLLVEGRTPRRVEGVMFSGAEGMLPRQSSLEAALRDITRSRVKRAFEAAKNKVVPRPLMADLGLGEVDCVYHVSLELDSLGADAYLAQAGWIRDGGPALEPPQLVEPRFTVEVARADGETTALPLTGPYQETPGEGLFWEHASDIAKVVIIDGCPLSGSLWTVAGAVTDEPLELTVTDTVTSSTTIFPLWTDREEVSRLVDTASLAGCP
jgi:hypothetical protein